MVLESDPALVEGLVSIGTGIEKAVQRKVSRTALFRKLAAKVPADKRASERDEVRWALENVLTPVEDLVPESVPSRLALKLLDLAQRSDDDFKEIVFGLYSKLMPTRQQLDRRMVEDEERFTDEELLAQLPRFRVAG